MFPRLQNNFWVVFFVFFLFQLAMISFAFLLSSESMSARGVVHAAG